jgi:hypothetical protein
MRILVSTFLILFLLIPVAAFPQAANGRITGTVIDASGAVLPGVTVEVTNTATGVAFSTVSTETGVYSAPNLPPGAYSISASLPGFKKYDRSGVSLAAAQTLRLDIPLEVGAATDSITITEEGTLLKSETGDIAHNITVSQLVDLPLLGIGNANAGSSGVRNPYNTAVTVPGVNYVANFTMIVNGAPTNTAGYRLEGLDNTNHTVAFALQENQPSADAIQEVAVQTSNYAPEFGQAGGGLFNITMKSGTSEYHGTGYEYLVNEALNAGYPFTTDGNGHLMRPQNRRHNFGGTIGGPVQPLTKGSRKTFFFFSLERFKESSLLNFNATVPTLAYRNGDFSAISPNGGANFNPNLGVPSGRIGVDALGRDIFANEIYDPATRGVTGGQGFANPFQDNKIPADRITPFAKAVMSLIPLPTNDNLTQNYTGTNISDRVTGIPSVKIDHSINDKNKFSFYWSTTGTESQYSSPNGNADGLPELITQARGTFIDSVTWRLNYDRVMTNSLLLHLGAGYSRIRFLDDSPLTHNGKTFDCATINLVGCQVAYNFPTFNTTVGRANGLAAPAPETGATTGLGGMQQMGNALLHTLTNTQRPAYNANMTWIHGNHNYKWGGEVYFQGNITAPPSGVSLTFASNGTAQPFTPTAGLGNQFMGFQFASFLLGAASSITQTAPTGTRMGKSQWAFYWQDSWKASRKLTLDYGLRWDYASVPRERYGRSANLGLTTPNPAIGGFPGAPIFQATCNCDFADAYPWAFGPRLGVAYQLTPKTVLRGGWGFAYGFAPDINVTTGASLPNTPSGINSFVSVSAPGAVPQPVWPNFDPGQTPLPGQITGFTGFSLIDRNAARPPRQNQYSFGIQREVTRDFVIDASYVGNRGVWWNTGGGVNTGPLGLLNQVSPARFAQFGLDPFNNPADNLLLSQPLSSTAVISRIGNFVPYPGYPTSNTLINALRPFPQFSTITVANSPTGNTWYDSLQVKGTKRMSKGLQVNGTYTFSRAFVGTRQNIFDPTRSKSIQSTDQPHVLQMSVVYQTEKHFGNGILSWLTRDWQVGAFMKYASGLPLTPPQATTVNNLPGGNEMVRTGLPLYVKDLNCHCFDPTREQVLNPAAWTNPAAGTYGPGPFVTGGTSLLYSDFRGQRRPAESFNIMRSFRLSKGDRPVMLSIRADFANIFNRTLMVDPITNASPLNAPTQNAAGQYTAGFGVINEVFAKGAFPASSNLNASQLPRQGTIVARVTF